MCKLIEGLQNIAKNEALNAMRLAYSMDEEGTACIQERQSSILDGSCGTFQHNLAQKFHTMMQNGATNTIQ